VLQIAAFVVAVVASCWLCEEAASIYFWNFSFNRPIFSSAVKSFRFNGTVLSIVLLLLINKLLHTLARLHLSKQQQQQQQRVFYTKRN